MYNGQDVFISYLLYKVLKTWTPNMSSLHRTGATDKETKN